MVDPGVWLARRCRHHRHHGHGQANLPGNLARLAFNFHYTYPENLNQDHGGDPLPGNLPLTKGQAPISRSLRLKGHRRHLPAGSGFPGLLRRGVTPKHRLVALVIHGFFTRCWLARNFLTKPHSCRSYGPQWSCRCRAGGGHLEGVPEGTPDQDNSPKCQEIGGIGFPAWAKKTLLFSAVYLN